MKFTIAVLGAYPIMAALAYGGPEIRLLAMGGAFALACLGSLRQSDAKSPKTETKRVP